jgi:hypothetical protein
MNRLRFHLAKGPNYMNWQLRNKKEGILEYYNPDEFRYSIVNGKLNNSRRTATRIFEGENKTVCSWISFESGFQDLLNFNWLNSVRLSYNPRRAPHWTSPEYEGCNLDGFVGDIYIINKSLYTNKESVERFLSKELHHE